ncbi:LamB/YcsF family protein [Pseudarthrobacter sp. NPDC058329]|uniref:LamB/YcsF family protein n=1 Tax=Pseudarthrobacter sp. NPDC058329 TaxID=3346448 RepID=UPI0036D78F45
MTTIDLNSDVGESFGRWELGDDAAMFQSVSSANVACGFHAGDPSVLRTTCASAVAGGVQVGAHPGYRDLANFGRRFLDVDPVQLTDEIVYQIGALQAIAKTAGTSVKYVKPHGALGNAIVHHAGHAQAVVDAVKSVDATLPILAMPNSEILSRAEAAGLRGVPESFADRAYTSDGRLASRSLPGAVLHDADHVAQRVVRMVTEGKITTIDGVDIDVAPESICVHGDTAGAVTMAFRVRAALESAGISIKSFV